MATTTTGSWAQLRQQARAQETQTESLFHTYSQYSTPSTITPEPSDDESRTEAALHALLDKRSTLLAHLARLLDSEPAPSALKSTNLARHREILQQHRADLARLRAALATARDRANLLSSVRSDIRAAAAHRGNDPDGDYMLAERARLARSHEATDGVLAQAYAVREGFATQRESLAGIQRRLAGAAARVPGVNSLVARIGGRKRRDGIILGVLVAACCLLLLWFW